MTDFFLIDFIALTIPVVLCVTWYTLPYAPNKVNKYSSFLTFPKSLADLIVVVDMTFFQTHKDIRCNDHII